MHLYRVNNTETAMAKPGRAENTDIQLMKQQILSELHLACSMNTVTPVNFSIFQR